MVLINIHYEYCKYILTVISANKYIFTYCQWCKQILNIADILSKVFTHFYNYYINHKITATISTVQINT